MSSNTFVADDGRQCLNVVTWCEYSSGEPSVRASAEVADAFRLGHDDLVEHEDVPPYVARFAERATASRPPET